MYYNTFKDTKLSALGFGTMRLRCDKNGLIYEETEKLVDYALSKGINYFETSLGYSDHTGEETLGKILSKHPRDSYYLVTKMPSHLSEEDKDKTTAQIFEEQLKRCQCDYFDFYLLHAVNESSLEKFESGIIDYIVEQKKQGRIKYLGFSSHFQYENLKKFVKKYRGVFDFCQIQINALDWNFQKARKKYKLLSDENLPVWVMEPLRGGSIFKYGITPEQGFTFLQGLNNIKVILSGMRSIEDIDKNLKIFEERHECSTEELYRYTEIAEKLERENTCTECEYCKTYCPEHLDIPKIVRISFEILRDSESPELINSKREESIDVSKCLQCGKCTEVCTQGLKVTDIVERLRDYLGSQKSKRERDKEIEKRRAKHE